MSYAVVWGIPRCIEAVKPGGARQGCLMPVEPVDVDTMSMER